jgi:hypothetical protein
VPETSAAINLVSYFQWAERANSFGSCLDDNASGIAAEDERPLNY